MVGQVSIVRANALDLPLADSSVDLVVTSPPYFGLRSYQDGCPDCADASRAGARGYMERYCPQCSRVFASGRNKCHVCNVTTLRTEATKAATAAIDCATCGGTGKGHYDGQIGAEATPAEFVDALIAATREMVRVLKPSGSIWVNLGDKYAGSGGGGNGSSDGHTVRASRPPRRSVGIPTKSLIGIPWRYAIRCIDDLGLILRAEVIWSKPNGLPESVTDRVRRSHEQWFHFTKEPRYYSAVDEVREEYSDRVQDRQKYAGREGIPDRDADRRDSTPISGGPSHARGILGLGHNGGNPLGKLPGSVWTIPTEPLRVPDHLGIDHFAAFPTEWPRRIITGWSPRGVCVECGEGRRPVSEAAEMRPRASLQMQQRKRTTASGGVGKVGLGIPASERERTITGEACDCPEPTAPTTPGVVLDPFGGTGTTALVADALGRHGISVDMSADYCRLATWRTTDPKQRAKAARKPFTPPAEQVDGQGDLLDLLDIGELA